MIEGQGHHTFTKIIAIVPVIILLFLKGDICIIAILCPPLAVGTLNSNYTNVPPRTKLRVRYKADIINYGHSYYRWVSVTTLILP